MVGEGVEAMRGVEEAVEAAIEAVVGGIEAGRPHRLRRPLRRFADGPGVDPAGLGPNLDPDRLFIGLKSPGIVTLMLLRTLELVCDYMHVYLRK